MFGCHQSGEDRHATPFDAEVVVTAPEVRPSELHDAEPAACGTVLGGKLFKRDDAVGDAVKLKVCPIGRAVIKEENGGLPA